MWLVVLLGNTDTLWLMLFRVFTLKIVTQMQGLLRKCAMFIIKTGWTELRELNIND